MTIKPKWRPILFRGDMISALLNTKVLFKEINGEESTDKNVWVWCLELKRLK